MSRLTLTLPDEMQHYPAAAFTQEGHLLYAGYCEQCEQEARENKGLFCYVYRGKPVIRTDFENVED